MPKCDFNKVAFSCKFAAYFQNTFFQEHLWVAASKEGFELARVKSVWDGEGGRESLGNGNCSINI